jgi:serine/threonine protein phosphatase PrpC
MNKANSNPYPYLLLTNSDGPALYTRPGIAAGASVSSKTTNQDACEIRRSEKFCTIAVADGLGSSFDAHLAASIATTAFIEECGSLTEPGLIPTTNAVNLVWKGVAKQLHDHYEKSADRYFDQSAPLQTTLLALIDSGDTYLFTYLGNGSLLYLRGDFWRFKGRDWPWCSTDLIVSHSFLDNSGRNRLYGILGPNGLTAEPNIGLLSKDQRYGEFLILCTDGISSADSLKIGRDPQEKLWLEANRNLEHLINQALPRFLAELVLDASPEQALGETLNAFMAAQAFDDDATLAVLVSQQAIAYARQRFGK